MAMDDIDLLSRAFSALARSHGSSYSPSLPGDILDVLHNAFGGFCKTDPSDTASSTPDLWGDLAQQGIPLSSLVHGLIEAMDKGGKPGLVAADVYLGFLLAPGSPLYSLFSQLAFDSLLRCIRNACKPIPPTEEGSSSIACANEKSSCINKRAKRKAKGISDKSSASQGVYHDDNGFNAEPLVNDTDFSRPVVSHVVLQLLLRLGRALQILHLKEHQESLRSLVDLLIELPHLIIEMHSEIDGSGESRSRKAIHSSSSSRHIASPKICFEIMAMLLEPAHGCPTDTAILIMKSLAPSILLTRSSGSYSQRNQVRDMALHFVTELHKSSTNHQEFRMAIPALPRYLAMKAPEKAEPRALAVESVMKLVKVLPLQDQRKFALFVLKLSHGKPRHRLFAVDLAFCLLAELPDPLGLENDMEESNNKHVSTEEEEIPEYNETDESRDKERFHSSNTCNTGAKIWWGIICLEALLHRCSDKVPAVRARALHNLAQVIELISSDIRNRGVLQNLLGFGTMEATSKETQSSIPKPSLFNSWHTPHQLTPNLIGHTPSPILVGPGPSPISPGVIHGDLGSLMRRRCLDNKVAVRKSALFLISKSASLLGRPPEEAMLVTLGVACSDPMVSIRKTALAALTEMVRKFPAVTKVVSEWFRSSLPLVMDNESNIQEECMNIFEELVIDRISAVATLRLPGCGATTSAAKTEAYSTPEQELERLLPPGILIMLNAMTEDGAIASCIKRICVQLGKKGKIRAGIVIALQNIITSSKTLWCSHQKEGTMSQECWTAPSGAWLLLAEVSAFIPKAVGWEFLRMHWQLLDKQIAILTPRTPKMAPTNNMVDSSVDRVHLLQTISNVAVELPPDAAADLAAELLQRLELFDMDPMEIGAHVKALHVLCLRKATSEEEGYQLVSTWVEELIEKSGIILESYLSMRNEPNRSQAKDSQQTSRSTKTRNFQERKKGVGKVIDPSVQVVPAIFTIGALVLVCPGTKIGNLAELVQELIASTSRYFDNGKCLLNEEIECSIHAHAWLTLGKICLANQDLAKRCVPVFLQELEKSNSAAVRNNIMVVMTDFCVRYTSLIDGYVLQLTKSLRDSCEIVRRQCFVLLAQLLQKDYLKWRGTLFHRFLLALVDDSEKIRQLASFLFGSILKTKAPLLAYNSFVETIFVLNDCHHTQVRHVEMLRTTESERKLFSLRGAAAADAQKRMEIYECLLRQMAPEHILATTAKLCADILATAADGMLDLNDPTARCVLEDSLKILASKEMRIGSKRGAVANCDALDSEEDGPAAFAAAKGRVVTQLAKRNLVQNAIPIFIELKRLLESRNSPLTGMLMECMRVMLKEYKNEIEEILVADKQLQKEIMYDMQKHEAAKAKAKAAAAASILLSPKAAAAAAASILLSPKAAAVASSLLSPHCIVLQTKNNNVANARSVQKRTETADKSKLVSDDKENASSLKGKRLMHEDLRIDPIGTLKRKTFVSPDASAHVRWLDNATATPKIPIIGSRRFQEATSLGVATTPIGAYYAPGAATPGECSEQVQREQFNMASAVANVAAEATAAAVLDEVARGAATPLQAMSIPKLHALVPSTVKKATFLSRVANASDAPTALFSQAEEESFSCVRRRQSFSSIDVHESEAH